MRIRPLLAPGIALLAFALASANERGGTISVAPTQAAARPLPVFVPSPDSHRTRAGETYRNAARSADW